MASITLVLGLTLPALSHADVSLGLGKDNEWPSSEHIARMEANGLTDHATIYYKLMSEANLANPYDWVRHNYLDQEIDTVMVVIIDDGEKSTVGTSEGTDVSAGVPGLLEKVTRGDFDEALNELATEIKKDGRNIILRPFHEIDGGWYQWGIYADGNSAQLAVLAVQHVINVFDEVGTDNVSWEINFNRRDGRGEILGEAEFLLSQLNGLVDAYSVSTYNRCGTSSRYEEERSFAADFGPIYDRIAALSELPINIAEVSTSGLCAAKIPWFEEMLDDIDQRFTRTEMITFFFGTVPIGKASNDVPIYWGFDQSFEQLALFRQLVTARRTTESEPVQTAPASPTPVLQPTRDQSTPREFIFRERVTPPTQAEPTLQPTVRQGPFGFTSTPWSAWGQLTVPLAEQGNPAFNPVTGNEFGETGPLFRWTLTQRGLWDEGSFEHGPGLRFGGVHSLNHDQWWNNSVDLGLTYGFYFDAPTAGNIKWGGWSAELFGGRRQYLVEVPDRYKGDGEWTLGLNFGYSFGGDWLR